MSIKRSGRLAWVGAGVLVLAAAGAWQLLRPAPDDGSFVRGNGRIEATEVDVAAKTPGRVDEILVNEGDFVTRADVIARMDVKALQAQLAQARAEVANAHSARETARAQVAQRQADVTMAEAVLVQGRAEYDVARRTAARSQALLSDRATSAQKADDDQLVGIGKLGADVARQRLDPGGDGLGRDHLVNHIGSVWHDFPLNLRAHHTTWGPPVTDQMERHADPSRNQATAL